MSSSFLEHFAKGLSRLESQDRLRSLWVPQGLAFIDNDYLGLSRHPEVLACGKEAIQRYGAGSRGSRLLGGHSEVFERCEAKIAEFFNAPDSLFFSTGYLANLAGITALSEGASQVLSDRANHASLIDAVRLTKLSKTIVEKQGWEDIEIPDRALLVAETVFSMSGGIFDLKSLLSKVRTSDCFLYLDEAHAAGVFKEQGRGISEGLDLDWEKTALCVTFGKAFGVAGAAILCHPTVKQWLINRARGFIYTTAPNPVVAEMVCAALKVCKEEGWRREKLWERASVVREILQKASPFQGVTPVSKPKSPWEARSPIVAFQIPGDRSVLRFAQSMRESSIALSPIRHPTVSEGQERLRISLSLNIGEKDTERAAHLLVERWKAFLSQEQIPT